MNAANAVKTVADARVGAELAALDEAELARRLLTNDPDVWAYFMDKYTPLIKFQIGRTLNRRRKIICNDSVKDALGEFWVRLLDFDRGWLRKFDPTKRTLEEWLSALAWDVAMKHLRRLQRNRSSKPLEEVDIDHEPWNDRASPFFGALDRITVEEPPKLKRSKWR